MEDKETVAHKEFWEAYLKYESASNKLIDAVEKGKEPEDDAEQILHYTYEQIGMRSYVPDVVKRRAMMRRIRE